MKSSSKKKPRGKSKAKAEPQYGAKVKVAALSASAKSPSKSAAKMLRPPQAQRLPITPLPPRNENTTVAQKTRSLAKPPLRTAYAAPAARDTGPRLPPSVMLGTIAAVLCALMLVSYLLGDKSALGADQLISQAQEALQQQNWPAALGAIQKVSAENRQQPAFQRVLADYLEQMRSSPYALVEVLERLKKSGEELRPMDQLWLCRAWLTTKHLDKARAAWEAIPAPLCEGLEATRLKVELLHREGQLKEAAQLQADLNADFADVPLIAVRLAVAEVNGPFPEVRQKAAARLWELAQRRDAAGLEALGLLGLQDDRTERQAADLLALMSRHPLARPADRQSLASLLMRLSPARRAEVLQTEIDRCAAQDPLALAVWLAREGETARLMQLSPELRRVQPVTWFQTAARALAEAKRWEELLKLVQQEQAEVGRISPAELLRWRAVALMQLHPQDVSAPYAELQQSIRQGAVEKNFSCVTLAAQIAEDWHMLDLALEAGLVLARTGAANEAHMLENCRRVARLLKDTEVLAEVAARLTALQPENALYARQHSYLLLLRGDRIETTSPPEDTTFEKNTLSLLVLALKAWRLNDRPHAAELLNAMHDTSGLTAGERAVYAGLLATVCGKVSQAYQIAEKIRTEILLKEEWVFLKQAL